MLRALLCGYMLTTLLMPGASGQEWTSYGADPGGSRYSPLTQITRDNVATLVRAWDYQTGDLARRSGAELARLNFETTPILVESSLVFCTGFNEVIALNPGTGAELWRFDPKVSTDRRPGNQYTCRGVTYWKDPGAPGGEACSARLFMGTTDSRLIALDAKTGLACDGFGTQGQVQIDPGQELWWPGEFQMTSPPVTIGDTVIIGSAISDNTQVEAPAGTVRAYNARTGEARWTFDPVPRDPDDPARASWAGNSADITGHGNVWAVMSVDEPRDLVFLPTSSPSPDFYGGERLGDNRYTDSVVALRGSTGELVWHFQTVHHDVWDYDLAAQPGLFTIQKDGVDVDVVVQATKTGLIFVLDRETGVPVIPVEERAVPQSDVEGEVLSPTQPFPLAPPPLVGDGLGSDRGWGYTFWDAGACRDEMAGYRFQGLYTPPSLEGTILYPFTGGGANWGGGAFEPARDYFVINMNNIAHLIQLFPSGDEEQQREVFHEDEIAPQDGTPYGVRRKIITSPLDAPCTPPPWGIIAAVHIPTGEIKWSKPLGNTRNLAPMGIQLDTGTPTLGGPLVTASGLIIIGATMDDYIRALDIDTGKELWRADLPAGAFATPMTYSWAGEQYVAIAAGGYPRIGAPVSDHIVTFKLAARKGWRYW